MKFCVLHRDVRNASGEIELALTPRLTNEPYPVQIWGGGCAQQVQGLVPGPVIDVALTQSGLLDPATQFRRWAWWRGKPKHSAARVPNLELAADMAQDRANRIEVLPGNW